MRAAHHKRLLDVSVPFAADVEKTGVHRAPVSTFARSRAPAQAYDALWRDVLARL